MTIRTRSELDAALLRVFVEALADEPLEDCHDAVAPAAPDAEPEEEDIAARPLARSVLRTAA